MKTLHDILDGWDEFDSAMIEKARMAEMVVDARLADLGESPEAIRGFIIGLEAAVKLMQRVNDIVDAGAVSAETAKHVADTAMAGLHVCTVFHPQVQAAGEMSRRQAEGAMR